MSTQVSMPVRASPADVPAGFRTKRDAVAVLNELLAALDVPSPGRVAGSTLGAYLQEWLERARHEVRLSTLAAYRNATTRVTAGLGDVPLGSLTPLQVQQFETALLAGDMPLSSKTVANVHAVLHRALADAVRLGLVDRNVAAVVDPPRFERPELNVWTVEQVQAFLRSARGHRAYPVLVLLVTTGMRRSESRNIGRDGRQSRTPLFTSEPAQ